MEFVDEKNSIKTWERASVLLQNRWFKIQGEHPHMGKDSRVIIIHDESLCSCIVKTIAVYITHTGMQLSQGSEIKIQSPFEPLILNYDELDSVAGSTSTDSTVGEGLRLLLDEVNKIHDPSLWRIPEAVPEAQSFRVQFNSAWALFKPGSLIVSSWNQEGSPQVFKVHQVNYKDFPTDKFYQLQLNVSLGAKPKALVIHAWAWDWNGRSLFRNMLEFIIESYSGHKSPRELSCYPATLYEGPNNNRGIGAIYQDKVYQNRKGDFVKYTFQQKSSPKLLRYSGDFRGISGISGSLREAHATGETYNPISNPTPFAKIDEDIILDTVNYTRKALPKLLLSDIRLARDARPCHCHLCLSDETKRWVSDLSRSSTPLYNENELLLPPRLMGFALNMKQWGAFSLQNIGVSETFSSRGKMEGLVLPPDLKEDEQKHIFEMVSNHSIAMAKPRDQRMADMIWGKGESLILLFHGYSGTGKTLYAESLAKSSGRPLFKVGTSDIGFNAPNAERMLKNIFELAEAWNAVLLIDEADVLLDARGKENDSLVFKNALVSVLLREVEYFKGVLIMTTNRVIAFDPAMLSRIHHAVNFGEPETNQEKRIWEMWLHRLDAQGLCDDFADLKDWVNETVNESRRPILSGREIRNIFIVAQMLAERGDGEARITRSQLSSAYKYKKAFRHDTDKLESEAKALLAKKSNRY